MNKNYLNTLEVAKILNVNESTIKRWTDSGFLSCVRTPGGHRKFTVSDIQKFTEKYPLAESRELSAQLKNKWNPEVQEAISRKDLYNICLYFRQILNDHTIDKIAEFLIYLYLNKYETSIIYDKVIKQTMEIIGESWKTGEIGIEDEHYYTGIIENAIQGMHSFIIQKPANGLTAICGCLENEQHDIGIRCMTNQLMSDGWKTYYIGSSLPVESFLSAINTYKPNLVCLSSSLFTDELRTSCDLLHFSASNLGAKFIVGGLAFNSLHNVSADYAADSISAGSKYANEIINLLK